MYFMSWNCGFGGLEIFLPTECFSWAFSQKWNVNHWFQDLTPWIELHAFNQSNENCMLPDLPLASHRWWVVELSLGSFCIGLCWAYTVQSFSSALCGSCLLQRVQVFICPDSQVTLDCRLHAVEMARVKVWRKQCGERFCSTNKQRAQHWLAPPWYVMHLSQLVSEDLVVCWKTIRTGSSNWVQLYVGWRRGEGVSCLFFHCWVLILLPWCSGLTNLKFDRQSHVQLTHVILLSLGVSWEEMGESVEHAVSS